MKKLMVYTEVVPCSWWDRVKGELWILLPWLPVEFRYQTRFWYADGTSDYTGRCA